MKLFSKKPAEAKSGASGAASTEPLSAERADEILREYSPEDNERQLTKWVARVVNVFSLFISLFLVYTAAFGQLPAMQQRSLYLLCAMVILFLVYPAFSKHSKKGVAWYDYLFAAASFGCCLYAFVNYEDILLRFGISNSTDQFVFVILAVLILEGTRRLVSPALSLIKGVLECPPDLAERLRRRSSLEMVTTSLCQQGAGHRLRGAAINDWLSQSTALSTNLGGQGCAVHEMAGSELKSRCVS